jgi:hypothetical protein
MSSELEQFELPTKENKKFQRSSLYTSPDIPNIGSINSITDWGSFGEYINTAEQRKSLAKQLDKERRDAGEKVAANSLSRYDMAGTRKLGELVGNLNVGVKYRPDWVAEPSATEWLKNEMRKAERSGDDKQLERLQKWAVRTADLDDDPRTPNNVIMFSDRDQGRIQAIDGYQLVPRERKEGQRAFYSKMPEREARQQADPAVKKFYKQYYNKYPTPDKQAEHPIEKFIPSANKSVFQIVRDEASAILNKLGFIIKKKDNAGTIIAQHFMPIVQKLSTALYHNMVEGMYPKDVGKGYDWEDDPAHIKTKSKQKGIIEDLKRPGTGGRTYWQRYINDDNTWLVMRQSIENSVAQINRNAGETVLEVTLGTDSTTGARMYNVVDLNVIQETQRKASKKAKGYPMPKVIAKRLNLRDQINPQPHPNGPTFPSSGTVMKGEMPKETPWGEAESSTWGDGGN